MMASMARGREMDHHVNICLNTGHHKPASNSKASWNVVRKKEQKNQTHTTEPPLNRNKN